MKEILPTSVIFKTIAFLLFILLIGCEPKSFKNGFNENEINILLGDIETKSWPKNKRYEIFTHDRFKKLPNVVSANTTAPIILKHDRYAHFLQSNSIKRAYRFGKKWRTVLKKAAKKYKVDKEVILAILLVETRFGAFTGKYPVASVFASIYVDSKKLLDAAKLSEAMKKRVIRKQNWAKNELQALFRMNRHNHDKLLTLKGSYAGAFGLCQFLPSSYLSYSKKAFGKGSANLFYEPDAIYSVANYLKGNGYRKGRMLASKRNYQAIFRYNNSNVYVDTVIGVAKKIRVLRL